MNTLYVAAVLVVGFCVPIMSFANGLLAKTISSPYVATLISFCVAAMVMTGIVITTNQPFPATAALAQTKWFMWIGGLFIVMNIVTLTVVPQKIGVGNTIILFVSGQIFSSVIIDHFGLLNFQQHALNWQRLLGVALLVSGIILIKKY